MKKNEIMNLLALCDKDDIDVNIREDKGIEVISVTVQDFEGFDRNWREMPRELNDWSIVEAIETVLNRAAINNSIWHGMQFEDCRVHWSYASEDI